MLRSPKVRAGRTGTAWRLRRANLPDAQHQRRTAECAIHLHGYVYSYRWWFSTVTHAAPCEPNPDADTTRYSAGQGGHGSKDWIREFHTAGCANSDIDHSGRTTTQFGGISRPQRW